jgi:AraC-like DNA-binding protein
MVDVMETVSPRQRANTMTGDRTGILHLSPQRSWLGISSIVHSPRVYPLPFPSHTSLPTSVETVACRVGISKDVLRPRFRILLKRTVPEEIVAAKIKCVLQLLLKSKLPLATIAVRAGFEHQEYISAVVEARTGMKPREWRHERRNTLGR